MQQSEVFHSQWLPSFPFMHRARQGALRLGVQALVVHGASLTIKSIGHCWSSDVDTKHGIKAADRLVGNPHLAAESEAIYQVMAGRILKPDSRPVVLVDWSDAHPDRQMQILRATVKFAGRSLVLYEQVFPLSLYNSRRAHQEFLQALARVLPKGVSPILVTDAGFRNPWFREVQAMGWDWLGRVRSTAQWRCLEHAGWQELTELHAQAGRHGQWLGQVQMARETPHQGYLYLAPKPHKARRKPSRNSNTRNDKRNRKSYSQPWVLFSSLDRPATEIIQIYRQRMTIEAGFRDLKSARFGMGMEYGRVTQLRRLKVLLLIAALAMWVLLSIGWMARIDGISRRLQANTIRDSEVLSVFNIARSLFERSRYHDWLRGCRFDEKFEGIG
jgi:hypothetical protein